MQQYCPLCNKSSDRFDDFRGRINVQCHYCKSLERHRFAVMIINKMFKSKLSEISVLHIAPEKSVRNYFKENSARKYVSIDLMRKDVDFNCDMTDLPFATGSFDLCFCSHVLEHIPQDIAAMKETYRVLKRGGSFIVMVPIGGPDTDEDEEKSRTPELRLKYYMQEDHFRRYGTDIVKRLSDVGFDVTTYNSDDSEFAQYKEKYRFFKNDYLFLAKRPFLKRILIVTIDFFPNIGGISFMLHNVANSLADQGMQVDILAPSKYAHPDGLDKKYNVIVDHGSDYRNKTKQDSQRRLDLISGVLKRGAYDRVLIGHPFYYGYETMLACRDADIKYSMFAYGLEIRSQILGKRNTLMRLIGSLVKGRSDYDKLKKIIRNADEMLPISNYTASLVKDIYPHENMYITGCGIQSDIPMVSFDDASKAAAKAKYGLSGSRVIGFVGRLVPSKSVDYLIKIAAGLKDVKCVIIGEGPEKDKLLKLSAELGTTDRVIFAGHVSEEEKWELMRTFDCCCLLSREIEHGPVEGFGIALLEAAAAGAAVVGNRSGGIVDVIDDGTDGLLVDVEDTERSAEAIRSLLDNPELCRGYVKAFQTKIHNRFNWDTIVANIKERWGK